MDEKTPQPPSPQAQPFQRWPKKGQAKPDSRVYRATASPAYVARQLEAKRALEASLPSNSSLLDSQLKPFSPRRSQEARVPELAYTQTFQTSPNSKAKIEVMHQFGKVQIKSTDLDLNDFEIKPKGKGWMLSFNLNSGSQAASPMGSPHISPNQRWRAIGIKNGPSRSSTPTDELANDEPGRAQCATPRSLGRTFSPRGNP